LARIFDNGPTTYVDNNGTPTTDADLGKYFWDADGDGAKGACAVDGQECAVDTWYNVAEGALKGSYTSITKIVNTTTGVNGLKSEVKPFSQKPVIFTALYNFGTEAAFQSKVDNSMAGQMRDCAECHVGGGAMEYIPVAQGTTLADDLAGTSTREDLRAAGPIVAAGVNTFNYFIDQYDDNDDGNIGEVLPTNYAETGVMEMDCLMCHLDGYSWEARKDAIRKGNFDASRVAGAGIGYAPNVTLGSTGAGPTSEPANYGKLVAYTLDPTGVENDGADNATLGSLVLDSIQASPPTANCSSCHFDLHKVDWKKRGTTWTENMAHSTEVHGSLGCMGCHTRDDGVEMDPNNDNDEAYAEATPDSPNWTGNAKSGAAASEIGHDPTKGKAPFSSLWNKNDPTTGLYDGVRTCVGCHVESTGATYYGFAGAPDPTNRHEVAGLTQTLIQTGGMTKMTGVADGNHLDLITCEGCHTKKLGHGPGPGHSETGHSIYEWGTGGALVDSTGPDVAGRLTDHETLYVERTMENNMTVAWEGGKIGPRNALLTMFWRDKDDLFNYGNPPAGHPTTYVDINVDGQQGAMDAVNPSHVRNAMEEAGLHVLTHDGIFDDAEIAAQKSALMTYLDADANPDGPKVFNSTVRSPKLFMSFMGVFFKANHGTTPAASAWGSGGCKDCHTADGGFYNGPYDLKPQALTAAWSNKKVDGTGATVTNDTAIGGKKPKWNHVVPFTKVNKSNYSGRDVTLPICSSYYGPSPRPAAPAVGTLGAIGNACVHPDTGAVGVWTVYPLGDIKADFQFTDFHPTIWAKGQTGRSIAITAVLGTANTIRTMDRSEGLWEKDFTPNSSSYDGTITGTDGNPYATRADWVNYLNTKGNYRPAIHVQHTTAPQSMDCSACHSDGAAGTDLTYAVLSDATLPAAEQFTYAAATKSCTTACHVWTESAATDKATAKARLSAQHAWDANFSVHLDASSSTCYSVNIATGAVTQGTKSYAWTIPATTTTNTCVDGLVPDCDVVWDTAGSRTVTVAVSCDGGANSNSGDFEVTAFDVGAGPNDAPGLVAAVVGNTVTITAPTLDADVAKVQILWDDVTNPKLTIDATTTPNLGDLMVADLIDDVTHTYPASGTYNVLVATTNDGDPNVAQYTYTLTVVIP
jgi:hypothetical protein